MLLPDHVGQLPKHVAVYVICVYVLFVQVVGFVIIKISYTLFAKPEILQQCFEVEMFEAKEEYFIFLKNVSFIRRVQV